MAHGLANVRVSRDESAWEVEVRAEVSAETLSHFQAKTLKEVQKTAELDGFRKGHAPVERILDAYGEAAILHRAAEAAIQHYLPELLASEKLLIIEAPKVTTESPKLGAPLPFTARAPLAPQVKLPDYKKIAAKRNAEKEDISVSDDEHKEALTHLRREKARVDKMEAGAEPQKASEESRAMKEEELPALDDAFVQSLGIESAEKFSETIRANIRSEKEIQAKEKRRAAILDELADKSTVKYPALLREYELDDMEARIKHDLERTGTNFDAYLAHMKKTQEELRKEWRDAADKRAKVRLILSEIARQESIEPDTERLEKELARAREQIPSADPAALRAHISHALRNEKTLEFLEKLN